MASIVPSHINTNNNPQRFIPVHNSLANLSSTQSLLIKQLAERLQENHNSTTHNQIFYVRAPGRVNIIGEHIDYCGYGVLPMAIDKSCVIAVQIINQTPNNKEGNISIYHYKSQQYPSAHFSLDTIQSIDVSNHRWFNYIQCGFKGTLEKFQTLNPNFPIQPLFSKIAINLIIHGDIPQSAGLSSSSALVVTSAVALGHILSQQIAHTNNTTAINWNLTAENYAELTAECERYVGTAGGGMDQAASLLSQPNYAQFIEFYPKLSTKPVKLPKDLLFLISNSLVEASKAANARHQFNLRVVEVNLAAKILAKHYKIDNSALISLKHVQLSSGLSLPALINEIRAKRLLSTQPYTREIIENILNVKLEGLFSENANLLAIVKDNSQRYELFNRVLHVYSEAQRVVSTVELLDSSSVSNHSISTAFGSLLNSSHTSLRVLYEASDPQLDELVRIITKCDQRFVGCRLTGAGWGGSCIAAFQGTEEDLRECVRKAILPQYYRDIKRLNIESNSNLDDYCFITSPSAAAAIYKLSSAK
jgi:galactokinase